MKLSSAQITSFIAKPNPSCRAVLIYGADGGLVKMQQQALLKSLKINLEDKFALTQLDCANVLSEPAILYDALNEMSLMMVEPPCVVLRDGSNKLSDILKDIYASDRELNYLIITAGELDNKSSLRALFEDDKRKNMAAIPCYRAEGAALTTVIRAMLQEQKINVSSPDVLSLLTSMLGNDRAIIQSEIEKISIYMGAERNLTPEIVLKCCADSQHLMLNEAMLEWLAGNKLGFLRTLDRLLQSGENMVAALRVLQYLFVNLTALVEKCAKGGNALDIVKGHRPFINFASQPLYVRAINKWKNQADLMRLQHKMLELEVKSKSTGVHDFMIIHELICFA